MSLGNLSESPSPVDVYLYPSDESSPRLVEHDVAYGTILPYQAVSAGNYTVKVRAAGSSALSNPVWSVGLAVKAGGAYTVVPLRASAQQGQLRVIDNNLATPKGKSFVRVIQADLNQGQVTFHCSCAAGAPGNITTDAAPGTVSPQAPIPAGTWTMTATGPSAKTSLPVTAAARPRHRPHRDRRGRTPAAASRSSTWWTPPGFARHPSGGSGGNSLSTRRTSPYPSRRPGACVPIASLAFSPSGATLAIASERICLWDIAAARCTGSFGNAESITAVTFSP